MATISTIVSDADIQIFKDSITKWQQLKKEVVMANDAGIETSLSAKDIDKKIADTTKIIEAYTGKPYRP